MDDVNTNEMTMKGSNTILTRLSTIYLGNSLLFYKMWNVVEKIMQKRELEMISIVSVCQVVERHKVATTDVSNDVRFRKLLQTRKQQLIR